MNKRSMFLSLMLVLVLALTAACSNARSANATATPAPSTQTPQPTQNVQTPTDDTPTPTNTMVPTPTCTPTIAAPVDNGCPVAQAVAPGNASNSYTFVAGSIYHMNLSLEGAPAGTEGNLLFKATTTFTANFDGAAWLYSGMITSATCQYCDETKGDYVLTLADVPQLTGLIEVLNPPCTTGAGPTTLPVHKLEVVQ